jgi:hypothetical protein
MWPGRKVGANICSIQARKHSPFIGPSRSTGAMKPANVRPPTKVMVFPMTVWDCGAAPFAIARPAAKTRHVR